MSSAREQQLERLRATKTMQPPKCRSCGERHWERVCPGKPADADAPDPGRKRGTYQYRDPHQRRAKIREYVRKHREKHGSR